MAGHQRLWLLDTRELVSEIWDNRIPQLTAYIHLSYLLLCLFYQLYNTILGRGSPAKIGLTPQFWLNCNTVLFSFYVFYHLLLIMSR